MTDTRTKIAVIGCGARGGGLIGILAEMPDVKIIGLCDIVEERMEKQAERITQLTGDTPFRSNDWHDILELPCLEAVVIATPWVWHIPITIAAMKKGIRPGCEVGGAFDINDCWRLVECYEETGVMPMLLENRCWNRDALLITAMARKGLFGDIVSCSMGYMHDLRTEVSGDRVPGHGRIREYQERNCNNYATHPLGPCARLLGVNRGNRIVSLTAMASRAAGMADFISRTPGHPEEGKIWRQGDITEVLLQLAHGEMIRLTLDTTLPRRYSHGFFVHGTHGMFNGETREVFIEGLHKESDPVAYNNLDSFREEYEFPVWREYAPKADALHGGIDYLTQRAFIRSVQTHLDPPIDVYDMAAWKAVTPLSEASIRLGSHPMEFPDFTRGMWIRRNPII